MGNRILVVEDEAVIRGELQRILGREGYEVVGVASVPEAREQGLDTFDLVITDLRLPGPSGDTLLDEVEQTPVVVMTAYGSVRSAVDAMKRGAADYLSKPFEPDELVLVVRRVLEGARLKRKAEVLESAVEEQWAPGAMVGRSPAMQVVFSRVTKVAPTDATVLILGESGTGKELVARAIHAQSGRAKRAFVAVNCASIPEGLIESELFGHERGAFTGAVRTHAGLVAAAHEGTLFLDEIGELPPPAQARLLRVLQESEVRRVGSTGSRRVDVRILAATHRDLPAMVEEGSFREDLFFRLRVLEIELPPLRERGADVLELADVLLTRAAKRLGRGTLRFAPEARDAIASHRWPGNVRELLNAIERAVILHDDGLVTSELLGLSRRRVSAPPSGSTGLPDLEDPSLEGYFRAYVLAHQEHLGEKELAEKLGVSRKTLWERRQKLGIPRPEK
ncbi:MAG: sigma-54-dependent Fis family transcriptional regulator [Sandaracinus sp.]|nr:sigma-54-dependent Fis family transcriptional regulator [Sandaracinus sp.]